MSKEIQVRKSTLKKCALFVILIVTVLLGWAAFDYSEGLAGMANQDVHELEAKFAVLSKANTNSCGGGESYVSQLSADRTRIQGSCCSSMNFHRYSEQIEGLKKYSNYEIIPKDPYDVSSVWADRMIDYGAQTQLSKQQQGVYDKAMELSDEGGPCCCKCWHWYAYEGLAKYLIVEENFSAEQIAEVWDLSDACGGSGHIEGSHGHA